MAPSSRRTRSTRPGGAADRGGRAVALRPQQARTARAGLAVRCDPARSTARPDPHRAGPRPGRPPVAAASLARAVVDDGRRRRAAGPVAGRRPLRRPGPTPAARLPRSRRPRTPAHPGRGHRVDRPGRPASRGRPGIVGLGARQAAGRDRCQPPARRPRTTRTRPRRRHHHLPRLARARPAGRGAARGPGRSAGRRPDARAARHRRDVSRHRAVRPAGRVDVRTGHRRVRGRTPRSPTAGAAGRSLAAPGESAAGGDLATGRVGRIPGHRRSDARPVRTPPGRSTVRLPHRGSRAAARAGHSGRYPVGARRRPPRPVRDGRLPAEHVGGRHRPAAARRGHGRDRRTLHRHHAAARRRRLLRRRTGRAAGRVSGPGHHRGRPVPAPPPGRGLDGAVQAGPGRADLGDPGRRMAARPRVREPEPAGRRRRGRPARGRRAGRAGAGRGGRPAGRRVQGSADPGQLPDRHADHVHDAADALGPPPGGLPARTGRRRLPAGGATRR